MPFTPADVERLLNMSDEDLSLLYDKVMCEFRRRDAIQQAKEEADRVAREYAAAVADAEPKKIEDLSKAASVGPGETVTFPNGKWRNVSGQWLSPHTQGPSSFWQGWMKLDGKKIDLQALKPWGVGFKVNAGDQCRHDGKAWRALQEHTTVAEWAPGMAPLLWQLVE
jgi:hypothetical protein